MITKEILEIRKTGIGGSDVAAILGISKYKTCAEIWSEKIGSGTAEKEETELMHWGNVLEEVIAVEYAKKNNVRLKEPTETYRHKEYPFLLANPDRLIEGVNAILECKTANQYMTKDWGEEGTDCIPTEYLLQVAHYRYVTESDYVDIAVLIGGNCFKQYRYVKNEELESKMITKLCDFWKINVEGKTEPEPKTAKDVELLFRSTDKTIEADEELQNKIRLIAQLKLESEKIEEEIRKNRDEVCVRLKDASKVVDNSGEVMCTYKDVVSKRFDSAKFKKEHADTYNEYSKESVSRFFRVNQSYLGEQLCAF
jgi:putative phage-type endonuclease